MIQPTMKPQKRQFSDNNHCIVCGAYLTKPDINNTQYCNNPKHTEKMTNKHWYFDRLRGWLHK